VFAWYVGAWCAVDCRFPSFGFVVEREGWLGIGCVEARWCVWCGCAVANLQAICQMAQQPEMTRHNVQRTLRPEVSPRKDIRGTNICFTGIVARK
jgi:hypothetical protein